MAVSYTYQVFCNQISWELGNRTDLLTVPTSYSGIITLSPIQQAVQSAIAKWERTHFYFNEIESINAFNTVVGQEFYTSSAYAFLGTGLHIDKIWVLISSNRYSLNPRTEQYMSDTSLNPSVQGQPIDYSYYAETLRLYPIPDGAYPLSIEGVQRFTTLVNNSDTNVWLQDAADLIKAEAKMDLYTNTLKDFEKAKAMEMLIHGDPQVPSSVGYLDALQKENVSRPAQLKMRAMYF